MLADAPGAWDVEAGIAHRTLVERDAAGARLLKESGPLARLRITARPSRSPAGRIEFTAALAQAQLDYAGRTQGGAALSTTSRHREIEAGLRWLPLAAGPWGEPSVTLDALRFARTIGATSSVHSLAETSLLWMPGVAWTTPAIVAQGVQWTFDARWRASVSHRLHVDYSGLFDPSSLRGGHRNEFALGARAQWPGGWSMSIEARRARQQASSSAAITSGGVPAGTVRQPRIAIDDVALAVRRQF